MKIFRIAGPLIATLTISVLLVSSSYSAMPPRKSPHESIYGKFDNYLVTVVYGRPFSKDPKNGEMRKIWGGLVPWDMADRLGADEATTLLSEKPLVFGETTVPPGAYTLYIIPSETGTSKLALSTNIGKWGIPVDEKHDLARFDLKKESLDTPVNQLTLEIVKSGGTEGVLKIMWENTQYSLPFSVKK